MTVMKKFLYNPMLVWRQIRLLELMKRGIGGNYIVVGKPMSDKEATEGYVRLDTLSSYVEQV